MNSFLKVGLAALALLAVVPVAVAVQALKEDTATTITVGPFVDATDGVTPENAMTVTAITCTIVKDGGTSATSFSPTASAGSNDMVFVTSSQGYYNLELTATNTDTAGRFNINCIDTDVAVPSFHEFMVMPTNEYDSLFSTDVLQVHVIEYTAGVIDSTAVGTLTGGDLGVGVFAANAITDAATANDVQVDVLTIETVDATDQLATAAATAPGLTAATLAAGLGGFTSAISMVTSQTVLDLANGPAVDDLLNNRYTITIYDNSDSDEPVCHSDITDWTGATQIVTFNTCEPTPATFTTSDTVLILPNGIGAQLLTDVATGTAVWAAATRELTALDEDTTTMDLNATATGAAASVTGVSGACGGGAGIPFIVQTDGSNSATQVKTDLTDADYGTDQFGGASIPKRGVYFTSGNAEGLGATIQSFVAATDILTFTSIGLVPADAVTGCIQ